jgi:hypothetical protein
LTGINCGAGIVVSGPPHAELVAAATFSPAGKKTESLRSPTAASPPVIVNLSGSVLPIEAVLWAKDAVTVGADAALAADANVDSAATTTTSAHEVRRLT